jgi:hypothetical protein
VDHRALGLADAERAEQLVEALAVLAEVDRVGAGAEDGPDLGESLSGVWPPNCRITPRGCSRRSTSPTCSAVTGSK